MTTLNVPDGASRPPTPEKGKSTSGGGKKPAWVASGSFNFTKSACRHHENLMFIEDPDVAQAFYEEFLKLKEK